MKFRKFIKENNTISKENYLMSLNIGVVSNVVVNQLESILNLTFRQLSIKTNIEFGNYDNILQDSYRYAEKDIVLVFWELANISNEFHFKAESISPKELDILYDKIKKEINTVLTNLNKVSLILFNTFSHFPITYMNHEESHYSKISNKLNTFLNSLNYRNLKLINIDRLYAKVSLNKSYSFKMYYLAKMPYTIEFLKQYIQLVKPIVLSLAGMQKKVLLLDCDNTIWGGILGEDGFDGIRMSNQTFDGAIFSEIQSLVLTLISKGVIIGLCSKNNTKDVTNVFNNHLDIRLKLDGVAIMRVNWDDKATNIESIVKELNIGIDSVVFIDDSPFEINLVKTRLPEVATFQVPNKIQDYPILFRNIMKLFYSVSNTNEDKSRTVQYKQESLRKESTSQYSDLISYLKSLKIKISISINDNRIIPRLSQMTQKTNQFNLTTKRYSESDIERFIFSTEHDVISWSVSDKFGDSGITGLCIIEFSKESTIIDTFLMSCRILGRNIEYVVLDYIIKYLRSKGVINVSSIYIKTMKNKQVSDFYIACGFQVISHCAKTTDYILDVHKYKSKNIRYIKIENGK